MSNMEELRYLTDVANDPALEAARRKFKKGIKRLKKKLKRGTRKSSVLKTKKIWQRQISGNAIIGYEQFDPELATVVVVSVRPEKFGGDIVVIDGQHTAIMDIIGGCDHDHDTLELHHAEDATLEEVLEAEARLYKSLNTQIKKLSKLDIIRVDIFLEEQYAVLFETILKTCRVNLDNIGCPEGTPVKGTGARMIKTIEQYGEDYSSYIVGAVNFIRDTWGSEENPMTEIRDDLIHGLTTLFVFLDKAGKVAGGSAYGLNGKKAKLLSWMKLEMGKQSMRKWVNNTAGGNTQFKIVHKIIEEYNFWAEENAPTLTITSSYLHENGILDPNIFYDLSDGNQKAARKRIPTFPADIIG